jgi:D-alanyl-D-alanine carboxypeptidase
MRRALSFVVVLWIALFVPVRSQAQLSSSDASRIDDLVQKALAETSSPSASIAVVKDGAIAYVKAYGNARLDPPRPSRTDSRYPIGSVSKQFMSGCVLLLAEEGKLSLSDPVSKYLPSLTRANEVTIRELLSHTSGYQDYYPLDYVAPFMRQPVTADGILDRWAKKALDFDPGTEWQYSNTNYVAAGRIVEIVSGMQAFAFLKSRILDPLGMTSAIDLDTQMLTGSDAAGYTRFGPSPPRPVTPEGRGWLFAAGELAMTPHDLALWDLSLMQGKVLKASSLDQMTTPARLKNGAPTDYGLGVGISNADGHPRLGHGGAVSGFVSDNLVWLDQGAAVAVLTNLDGSRAAGSIAGQIGPILLEGKKDPEAPGALAKAKQVFGELQEGKIDRSLLTSDCDSYFTPQVLADAASSLKPLGPPTDFQQVGFQLRGGMSYRHFRIRFASGSALILGTFFTPDGKLAQYLIQ